MRFRVRHAQQSIADHVEARLNVLGWMETPGPWGAKPVRVQEVQPDEVASISPNLVSTLIESTGVDEAEELGALVGGLMSVTYELFIDVYGEKLSITWSIAEDVKDCLSNRTIPLYDYTESPRVKAPGHIELEQVRIVKPLGTVQGADVKKNWRSVVADAVVYFQYEPELTTPMRASGDAAASGGPA